MSEAECWIEETKKEIEKIKEWKIEDRLSILAKLDFMNKAVYESCKGWQVWFISPNVMAQFSHDELKTLTERFEKAVLSMLELDLEYTQLLTKKKGKTKIEKIGAYTT